LFIIDKTLKTDKGFNEYLFDGAVDCLKDEGKELTIENVADVVNCVIEDWSCDITRMYEYYGYYIEDCERKGKPLPKKLLC